jgi:hypothetical protein
MQGQARITDHSAFLAKVEQRDAQTAAKKDAAMPTTTTNPQLAAHRSTAKWAKPLPHSHANFIPAQSWLAYSFVDKDPELDMVKFAIEESGMTLEQIEAETEKAGHKVSRYTLLNWYYGETRRPQNITMNTVMAVIGWERPWIRRG